MEIGGATDLATFLAAPAVLLAISSLACYLPARRARRLDPIAAMSTEL
jgi:ABC-type lipoprotein release transport system permease subunit